MCINFSWKEFQISMEKYRPFTGLKMREIRVDKLENANRVARLTYTSRRIIGESSCQYKLDFEFELALVIRDRLTLIVRTREVFAWNFRRFPRMSASKYLQDCGKNAWCKNAPTTVSEFLLYLRVFKESFVFALIIKKIYKIKKVYDLRKEQLLLLIY